MVRPTVRLDTTAAAAAVALLRDGRHTVGGRAAWAALIDAPAYRAWAAARSDRPEELLSILRNHPPEAVPDDLPAAARTVLAAFADGRADQLAARLVHARRLSVATAAERALAHLPADTRLEATVFVLLCGERQGLANDRGQVVVDLLSLPACRADAVMAPLLAHELHHIGFEHWRMRDVAAGRVLAGGGPGATAVRALRSLLSEGTANAFFTPTDEGWLRRAACGLADVHGTDVVDRFLERLQSDRARLPALLRQLDSVLATLAAGTETSIVRSYVARLTHQVDDLVRPIAHFVGEAMVQAIRRHAGDGAVIAAIAELRRFVPAYQAAAAHAGLPPLREATAEAIDHLWG